MNLAEAADLQTDEMVSLIGTGGKTTTLFRLAKELRDGGGKILVTTAKILASVIVGAGYNVDGKGELVGLQRAWLDQLAQCGQFDSILVEGR